MCHVVHHSHGKADNFSHADNAIKKLYEETKSHNTHPCEFNVEVFGGGNMFPEIFKTDKTVGNKNADIVMKLLSDYGFKLVRTDIGGTRARKITLFRKSGKVITVFVQENGYE